MTDHPDHGNRFRPTVALPRSAAPAWMFAAACAAISLGLFLGLETRRHTRESPAVGREATGGPPLYSPPPLDTGNVPALATAPQVRTIMLRPSVAAASFPVVTPARARDASGTQMAPAPIAPPRTPIGGPALIMDLAPNDSTSAVNAAPAGANGAIDDTAAQATMIRNRSTLVPQGTFIAAVLETPIISTRPGLVRAIVSRDVRGFDGNRILIPRGSRLIGEYRADIQSAQKRVLVQWTRMIRADGVAIRIGSPSADVTGGAGVPGQVNNHFMTRLASAVLQSALTVGVNLASRHSSSSVVVGGPGQAGSEIGQALVPGSDLVPTITVRQGADITVFVARDLDFAGASQRP